MSDKKDAVLSGLPDRPRNTKNQPPTTIANIDHLLKAEGIVPRYNVIKKRDEISIPGHAGTSDNRSNVSMAKVLSLASQYGLATGLVPEFVQAIADENAYNPVADWIKSKPWDGEDRLPSMYATIWPEEDYPQSLLQTLLHKWLLSAVAAVMLPSGFHCRGVLTLQGPQGINKTSWVRSLIDDVALREEVIKLDHHLDGGNKDSIIGAVTNWIVEIGELDSSFRKDIARLKGFLTSDADRVRRPYARSESEYQRRTVFVATVNDAKFLVDPTGNTRWWTISARKLRKDHGINMQQVYAQLADELSKGGEWWLTKTEEEQLEAWNGRHKVSSAVEDMVMAWIDLDRKVTRNVTASELLRLAGIKTPSNPQCRECGSLLRGLFGAPKRINGREKWPVPLVDLDAEAQRIFNSIIIKQDEY
jgi:Predicted P-loop ATPase and inactivated derivatives